MQRHIRGCKELVAELWEAEKVFFLPLPAYDYPVCSTGVVNPNSYIQDIFETNRYSIPAEYRDSNWYFGLFDSRLKSST
jgi:hypothetical protein